jgi:hypothetical protein
MRATKMMPGHVAMCLLLFIWQNGSSEPIRTIDQRNSSGLAFGGASSPDFLLGQSFIPSGRGIDAIELNVHILSNPAQMRIALLDGLIGADGLQGPVLGITETLTISQRFPQLFHFHFSETIPLTPDNTYVMRFEPIGPNSNPQIEISLDPFPPIDRYPRGQALQLHIPKELFAHRDFVFTEGLHAIPEPATLVLLIGVLVVAWKPRKTQPELQPKGNILEGGFAV